MLFKRTAKSQCSENQVTDEAIFNNRRKVLKQLGFMGAGAALAKASSASALDLFGSDDKAKFQTSELTFNKNDNYSSDELQTPEHKAANHNNFYEFGTGKQDPAENAQSFQVDPWRLRIDGLVETPITLDHDDLFKAFTLEERIYRLRCVEAWSMVIPWIGFPLAALLQKARPLSSAKYVAFKTLYDPKQMPGQVNPFMGSGIDYPYVEGLRLDEAMHPLTLMATGVYGHSLPPQHGAPIRLVVPWKYGFKSIKSIVSIKLTDKQPPTTWNILAPHEYGFYANVNPEVSHPRWSQARERRITTGGLFRQNRIDTQMFNGYADEVASLYNGMDLKKYF